MFNRVAELIVIAVLSRRRQQSAIVLIAGGCVFYYCYDYGEVECRGRELFWRRRGLTQTTTTRTAASLTSVLLLRDMRSFILFLVTIIPLTIALDCR